MTRAERIAIERKKMEKTLARTGVTALKKAGIKSRRPDFPDYSCPANVAPVSNGFGTPGRGLPPKTLPEGAREFPVGNSHKQGLELMLPSEVKWMNGAKAK